MLAEYSLSSPWAAETSMMLNTDLSSDLRCSYYWGGGGDSGGASADIRDVTDFFIGGIDPIFTSTMGTLDFEDFNDATFSDSYSYNNNNSNNNNTSSNNNASSVTNSPLSGSGGGLGADKDSLHHIFTLSEAMNNGNNVLADLSDNINNLYDTFLTSDHTANKNIASTSAPPESELEVEVADLAAHRALIGLQDDNPDLSQLESVNWSEVCETRSPKSKRKSEHCVTPHSHKSKSPSSASKRHRNTTENRNRNSSAVIAERANLGDHSLYCSSDSNNSPGQSSPGQGKRRRCLREKKWSRMTNEEQLDTIENLISYISSEMGLREQLEVIRIIKPSASIEPSATEFFIELDLLDDEKFDTIREVVEHFQSAQRNSTEPSDSQTCQEINSPSPSPTPQQSLSTQTSDKYDESTVESPKSKKGKNQVYIKQRQKKEYRQFIKERKSGLFSQEQILSLETKECDDEDIDILS